MVPMPANKDGLYLTLGDVPGVLQASRSCLRPLRSTCSAITTMRTRCLIGDVARNVSGALVRSRKPRPAVCRLVEATYSPAMVANCRTISSARAKNSRRSNFPPPGLFILYRGSSTLKN